MSTQKPLTKLYVSFKITGFIDCTPDDITDKIGIRPKKTYTIGQPMSAISTRVAKQNTWIVEAPSAPYGDFDQQIVEIADLLWSRKEVFGVLSSNYYCELSVAVYVDASGTESVPAIHFDKEFYKLHQYIQFDTDIDVILVANE
jgi:hypothetical protein